MENYKIRNANSAAEVRSVHVKAGLSVGFHLGIDDHEVFYATDPTGFFLGEVDGEALSCISAVKFEEMFAFIGFYVVEKAYRGKGYGLALFKHAMASLSPTRNCGLDCMSDLVPIYEMWGFKSTWINRMIGV